MDIDAEQFRGACEERTNWSVLEDTLYRLCRQYPGHEDRAGSNAKLVADPGQGRGFATGGRASDQIRWVVREFYVGPLAILSTVGTTGGGRDHRQLEGHPRASDRGEA